MKNVQLFMIAIIAIVIGVMNCKGGGSDDSGSPRGGGVSPSPSTEAVVSTNPSGSPLVSSDPSIPAKTQAECNSAGMVWIPVVDHDLGKATCGNPLSKWPCCKDQIAARFPNSVADGTSSDGTAYKGLNSKWAEFEAAGYHLYNCESKASGQYGVYFIKVDMTTGSLSYQHYGWPQTLEKEVANNCTGGTPTPVILPSVAAAASPSTSLSPAASVSPSASP